LASLVVADVFAGELTRGSFKTIPASEETTNTPRFEADSLAGGVPEPYLDAWARLQVQKPVHVTVEQWRQTLDEISRLGLNP